ncbi:MAG: hypothetical protein ACR2QM_11565 [Longimicrobiales bacterium]
MIRIGTSQSKRRLPWCLAYTLAAAGCTPEPPTDVRAALADSLTAQVARREAFSDFKDRHWGSTALARMEAEREFVLDAQSDTELFYALSRFSHARRDTHLSVALVPGGIQLADSSGLDVVGLDDRPLREAPVRFLPDYGEGSRDFFVADLADVVGDPRRASPLPPIGARLVSIGGLGINDWEERARPYIRSSTLDNVRWRTAQRMSEATAVFPPELRGSQLEIEVEDESGAISRYELPYHAQNALQWRAAPEPRYDGFTLSHRTPTYDVFVPDDDRRWVVLTWHGFRETMVPDIDALVTWADREGKLDHALIVDGTRSRGGSLGPYAVQRMTPTPFRTTFGNLRISDVVPAFIEEKQAEFAANQVLDGTVPETIDDGTWLIDWLETDVMAAARRGDAYSNDVPFKSAHGPRDSSGILEPAPLHFTGPMVVFNGPRRGSHLDQFVSIVVDNELGHVIGMPAAGYSNTWEWEETVYEPGTGRPLVQFMWNIGHTIRPNGEVLEGNQVQPDEVILLTSANVETYYALLLEAASRHLAGEGF